MDIIMIVLLSAALGAIPAYRVGRFQGRRYKSQIYEDALMSANGHWLKQFYELEELKASWLMLVRIVGRLKSSPTLRDAPASSHE